MLLKQKSSINSSDIAGTWKDSKRRTASLRSQDCMEPNSAFHVCTVQTVSKILYIFAPAYLSSTLSLLHSYYLPFTSPDGKASMLVIPTFYPLGGKASTSACSVVVWGQTTSMRRQSLSFDMVRHAITRFPSLPAPLTLAKQRNKPHARRFHIFHR